MESAPPVIEGAPVEAPAPQLSREELRRLLEESDKVRVKSGWERINAILKECRLELAATIAPTNRDPFHPQLAATVVLILR